jgi:WD40 repeat protein
MSYTTYFSVTRGHYITQVSSTGSSSFGCSLHLQSYCHSHCSYRTAATARINRCVFQWQRQRAPFTPPGAADGIESANATLDAAIKAETTPRRASAASTTDDGTVRGDLAYTRDGALAYAAGPALVLHTATAKAQRTLAVSSSAAAVVCAAVTSSGAYAAAADTAGAVRVWDVQRGAVVCALPKGLRDCARLAFSGDGKSLSGVDSANDSSICVWETATGKQHTPLLLHTSAAYASLHHIT